MIDSKNTLTIKDKKIVSMNGVKNVTSFDEGLITFESDVGRVTVEGADLKIEELIKESGEILIVGDISGVFFSENKCGGGLFKSLFK